MSALSEQECQNELLKNIDLNISIAVENKMEPSSNECWTRCLKHLPVFTLKDINLHRLSSGKDKNTVISKTLERGRKSPPVLFLYFADVNQTDLRGRLFCILESFEKI